MSGFPKARILLSSPEGETGGGMRFRLVYDGPLRANDRPRAKHSIRKQFHSQLKQLWDTHHYLSTADDIDDFKAVNRDFRGRNNEDWGGFDIHEPRPLREWLADQYARNGYRFVPLVREDLCLLCDLHILFLRRDIPGSAVQAGDIDNRIKTLLDALRMPNTLAEVDGNAPDEGENPFFCLLEDDKHITGITLETDTLLDPPSQHDEDNSRVRLVITVTIAPYLTDKANLHFI